MNARVQSLVICKACADCGEFTPTSTPSWTPFSTGEFRRRRGILFQCWFWVGIETLFLNHFPNIRKLPHEIKICAQFKTNRSKSCMQQDRTTVTIGKGTRFKFCDLSKGWNAKFPCPQKCDSINLKCCPPGKREKGFTPSKILLHATSHSEFVGSAPRWQQDGTEDSVCNGCWVSWTKNKTLPFSEKKSRRRCWGKTNTR